MTNAHCKKLQIFFDSLMLKLVRLKLVPFLLTFISILPFTDWLLEIYKRCYPIVENIGKKWLIWNHLVTWSVIEFIKVATATNVLHDFSQTNQFFPLYQFSTQLIRIEFFEKSKKKIWIWWGIGQKPSVSSCNRCTTSSNTVLLKIWLLNI